MNMENADNNSVFNNALNNSLDENPAALAEDEYIDPVDGLIYCRVCGKHRQLRFNIHGEEHIVRTLCKCGEAERDARIQEEERREFQRRTESLRRTGMPDRKMWEYTFDNDKGYNTKLYMAQNYVDRFEDLKADGRGLLLWGQTGTGKTYFAGCIANALIDKGISVYMTNFSTIINQLTGAFSEEKNQIIETINQKSLLIIDDLGIERNTDYATEQVYNVIDTRYRSGRPMIITTNIILDDLKNPKDLAHKRIYDRILERCTPILIEGKNIREINMEENNRIIGEAISKNNDG